MMRSICLLAVMLVLPGISEQARMVSGVVRDKAGNTLPKAVVELENRVTLDIRSYITEPDGAYFFHEMNPDVEFTLKAHYHNHWSKTETISKFTESKHVIKDLVIPVE